MIDDASDEKFTTLSENEGTLVSRVSFLQSYSGPFAIRLVDDT